MGGPELGKDFLDIKQEPKKKKYQIGFHTNWYIFFSKYTVKTMKTQTIIWHKIFAKQISVKKSCVRKYKELSNSKLKKQSIQ